MGPSGNAISADRAEGANPKSGDAPDNYRHTLGCRRQIRLLLTEAQFFRRLLVSDTCFSTERGCAWVHEPQHV